MSEYKLRYYQNSSSGEMPVLLYLNKIGEKDRSKVYKYFDYLREQGGYLDEPYARHILNKIRELRIDFFRNRHRIFYFIAINKTIILLHAFRKKSEKTPTKEIQIAINNYHDVINNWQLYEE
ncbi:MAG: type II toxin-antitoxin system RelE/ParE family toxin [Patescibacteria group bacterium]|jgi:phage-related protein